MKKEKLKLSTAYGIVNGKKISKKRIEIERKYQLDIIVNDLIRLGVKPMGKVK